MKSQTAALINSIVLILIGIWGFIANDYAIHTLIVPLSAGIILLIFSRFLQIDKPNVLLLVSFLTFILMLAFIVPFQRNAEQSDVMGMLRIGIEMMASAMALIVYLRNFVQLKMNHKTHD